MARIYTLFACHMLGDYVLQTDFLAKTKGQSWWHLVAHCVTYTVPFAMAFGIDWRIAALFVAHVVIDALKARWQVIGYLPDQLLRMLTMFALYLLTGEPGIGVE